MEKSVPEGRNGCTGHHGITRRRLLAASSALLTAPTPVLKARAQQPITLRVSSSYPMGEKASHYVWFQNFASYLKSETGDRIRFDYFPNSQIGGEAEVV